MLLLTPLAHLVEGWIPPRSRYFANKLKIPVRQGRLFSESTVKTPFTVKTQRADELKPASFVCNWRIYMISFYLLPVSHLSFI